MNKTELAQKIQTIEGLTPDERTALLGLLRSQKKYGLVWEDKPEDVERRLETELPVLKEIPSRAIISDNPDAPNHILIEGDNLEALTTLAYTHEGKIDVIYIDPPYNTGNKDFVYNDDYVDSEDSYRHSKWLSFMSKRLRLAKRLLSDRGVIFISIDDNEQAALKLLCDEIFGASLFISNIIWRKQGGGKSDSKYLANNTEYILCYGKCQNGFLRQGVDESIFNKVDEKGRRYRLMSLDFGSLSYHKSLDYPITLPNGLVCYPGGDKAKWEERQNGNYKTKDWTWRCSPKEYQKRLSEGIIEFTYNPRTQRWKVQERLYLDTREGGLYENIITDVTNRTANNELQAIFGERAFAYPKPTALIHFLLSLTKLSDAIVLDFFAGSGTTLHATMQLNSEDGGHRQCILVTNNENGICENVTYERNKRVINGYTKPNGEFVEGLHANNLRYYRTAFVGRRRTPQNMRRLMLLATDMLCIKENVYTERVEFAGMPTLKNGFRFFDDGKKQMLIIYNEEAIYDLVEVLENMATPEQPIITYVFSPANDPWRSEFETVSDKVSLTALPAAIYNAYKRVLPKPKDVIIAEEEKSEEPETAKDSLFDFDEVIDEVTLFTNKERGEA
ncbi:MAG: site-specific DNA-methyltransferase [Muribaculaceae bacterium]